MTFELMGMLGRNLHVRQTSFRMLPNPTIYRWDSEAFDLQRLLTNFKGHLQLSHTVQSQQIDEIRNRIEAIEREYETAPAGRSYKLLDALHDAIDTVDDYLTRRLPADDIKDVIRRHIQEVLDKLNDGVTFEELNKAKPLEKEAFLMDIYFGEIRGSLIHPAPPQYHPQQQQQPSNPQEQQPEQLLIRRATTGLSIWEKTDNIWCALVFRMLCWLMLHDFHKKDVQIPKSELLGSRLPVYIT